MGAFAFDLLPSSLDLGRTGHVVGPRRSQSPNRIRHRVGGQAGAGWWLRTATLQTPLPNVTDTLRTHTASSCRPHECAGPVDERRSDPKRKTAQLVREVPAVHRAGESVSSHWVTDLDSAANSIVGKGRPPMPWTPSRRTRRRSAGRTPLPVQAPFKLRAIA